MSTDQSISLTSPEEIRMYGLLQAAYRLALEINTGMKFRQSTISAAQRAGLTKKRTKKGVLADLVTAIQDLHPEWVPSAAIAKALEGAK